VYKTKNLDDHKADDDYANDFCNLKKQKSSSDLLQQRNLGCPYPGCQFKTARPVTLKTHAKSHRKCNLCGKEFSGKKSRGRFKNHMEFHERKKVKVFPKCQWCDKEYPYKSYLRKHLVKCNKAYLKTDVVAKTEIVPSNFTDKFSITGSELKDRPEDDPLKVEPNEDTK
jgi:hypothetical protein